MRVGGRQVRRARPGAPQMKTGQIGGESLFSSGAKKNYTGAGQQRPPAAARSRCAPEDGGWAGAAAAAPCCRSRRLGERTLRPPAVAAQPSCCCCCCRRLAGAGLVGADVQCTRAPHATSGAGAGGCGLLRWAPPAYMDWAVAISSPLIFSSWPLTAAARRKDKRARSEAGRAHPQGTDCARNWVAGPGCIPQQRGS